ncbi:putative cysteine protease [Mycobacterium marinum str. Europe]|nr:putative cysteine protease [Mycobacterium marinum str. Europe]
MRRRPLGWASPTRRNSTGSPTSIPSKARSCAKMAATPTIREKSQTGKSVSLARSSRRWTHRKIVRRLPTTTIFGRAPSVRR